MYGILLLLYVSINHTLHIVFKIKIDQIVARNASLKARRDVIGVCSIRYTITIFKCTLNLKLTFFVGLEYDCHA